MAYVNETVKGLTPCDDYFNASQFYISKELVGDVKHGDGVALSYSVIITNKNNCVDIIESLADHFGVDVDDIQQTTESCYFIRKLCAPNW